MLDKEKLDLSVVSMLNKKNITSAELSNKAGVNQSSASRFLKGKSKSASLDYMVKLSESVGITVILTAHSEVNNNEL
jgi:predicted XRE-type DNA-binding protein